MGRIRLALLACLALVLLTAAPVAQAQSPQPRIVGGQTTTIEQYPWQVALVLDERFGFNDFNGQFCGGALLTTRIVQTAAHCVFDGDPDPADNSSLDPNDLDVILGRTTLSSSDGQQIDVKGDVVNGGVYRDPTFNPATFENDYAWIVLAADANVASPAIETIDVAGADEDPVWSTGRRSQVSGWGDTSFGGDPSDTLQVATVPVISDATCGHPDIYGLEFVATSMVCAGYLAGGVDSCFGDSGGPMQAPVNGGGFRLVGLVSWGDGCAGANAPGVQSRIADYPMLQAKIDQIEAAEGITNNAESVIGTGGVPPPVTNDLFSAALNLGSGTNLLTATTNADATKETGEPDHAGDPGGHSLWHSWTAPGDGTTSVNLCGSDFELDTLLAVYVYVGGDLTSVASNDDSPGCGPDDAQSSLSFPASAGTTYRIAVDGAGGDVGRMELRLVHQPQAGGSGGSGGGEAPLVTPTSPTTTANDPYLKCHKLKSKKKRKLCFRKVRASLGR